MHEGGDIVEQPYGYLISAVIFFVGTVCALARLRGGVLGFISLYFGNNVNELPGFVLLFLIFNTGLDPLQDLESAVGRIAFGLTLLTGVGLIVVIRRAARTAPTIARAFTDIMAGLCPRFRGMRRPFLSCMAICIRTCRSKTLVVLSIGRAKARITRCSTPSCRGHTIISTYFTQSAVRYSTP